MTAKKFNRDEWFETIQRKADVTANNLVHVVGEICTKARHKDEDAVRIVTKIVEVLGEVVDADDGLSTYRAMEKLSEFKETPSLISLAIMAYAAEMLAGFTSIGQIDGTMDAVTALTSEGAKREDTENG